MAGIRIPHALCCFVVVQKDASQILQNTSTRVDGLVYGIEKRARLCGLWLPAKLGVQQCPKCGHDQCCRQTVATRVRQDALERAFARSKVVKVVPADQG